MEKIFLSQKQERKDPGVVKDPLIVVQNVDGNTAGTTPFKSDGNIFSLEGDMNALKIGTPQPDQKKVQFKISESTDFKKGLSPKLSGSKNPKLRKMLARKKFDTARDKMKKSNSTNGGSMSKFDLNKLDSIDDKFDF